MCSSFPWACGRARLTDPAKRGKEYKAMGVTAGVASAVDTDGVWLFIVGEIREEDVAAGAASVSWYGVGNSGVTSHIVVG